jgi:hypothetical protein
MSATRLPDEVRAGPTPSTASADREQAFRAERPTLLRRACACGGSPGVDGECPDCRARRLRRSPAGTAPNTTVPAIVHDVLRSQGTPLDAGARSFMEPRFGHDFGDVRVHTDARAASSAEAVNALAYTVGHNVVFGAGRYAPATSGGRHLLAHELTHVVQQSRAARGGKGALRFGEVNDSFEREADSAAAALGGTASSPAPVRLQRQFGPGMEEQPDPMDDPTRHPPGAPNAVACAPPPGCPEHFCEPYTNESYARHMRNKMLPTLLLGIRVAVGSRVLPLWSEHLMGGSSTKNLTADFGADFTASPTTKKTTDYLVGELTKSLKASPPPLAKTVLGIPYASLDVTSRLSAPITKINTPLSGNDMNFNHPRDIPGNIAGGIGVDETSCKSGAQPSPQNDERLATVNAFIMQDSSGGLTVTANVHYTVKDTIDLCPGDCGNSLEKLATVPISQFEATGISGDVPFIVEFDDLRTFTVPASGPPSAPATKPSAAPATAPSVPAPAVPKGKGP